MGERERGPFAEEARGGVQGGDNRYEANERALLPSHQIHAAQSTLPSVARSVSLQLLAVGAAWTSLGASQAGPDDFFGGEVRPILEGRCLKCHGGGKKIRGGLRLTSRESLLAGGQSGPAIDLEQRDESLLLAMVRWADEDHQMPPTGKLAEEEVATLARWVEAGVPWPEGVTLTAAAQSAEEASDAARLRVRRARLRIRCAAGRIARSCGRKSRAFRTKAGHGIRSTLSCSRAWRPRVSSQLRRRLASA
jgi:hypothetical protein